jgi:uncharacterized membrane protein
LNKLDVVETVLFSVGISIAFLMIIGLLVNEIGSLLGVLQPLSLTPLMIVLSAITLVFAVAAYIRNEHVNTWTIDFRSLLSALVFLLIPLLSILGAMWVNFYENNLLLLLMIFLISLIFAIGVLSKKLLPPKFYPFVVVVIAISLLYHSSLISNNILSFSSDIHLENFAFQTTVNNARWSLPSSLAFFVEYGRVNAMLSVTILPTIYSTILNINSTWLIKILFPLLFSLVPLGLYQLFQRYVSKKFAFISTFLFMAQATFYTEMLGLSRQIIAELFFILLFLVILDKKLSSLNRNIFFIIFGFALVVSHYALAEIFLILVSFVLISLFILKRPNKTITIGMGALFFVLMFVWYIYSSGSTVFDSFLRIGESLLNQLGEFFNPASRGTTVLQGIGLEAAPTIWNAISRSFAYIIQGLMVLGFIGVFFKRVNAHFEKEYFLFSSAAMALLLALIVVPGLANTFNMTRFYHVLLFFLAPFCVLGAVLLVKLVSIRKKELVVILISLIVLVPYFLFQTGVVYEFTNAESWSVSLSKHRMNPVKLHLREGYTIDQEIISSQWLKSNVNHQSVRVYADRSSLINTLQSYALLYPRFNYELSNVTAAADIGVVYLNALNVVNGIVVGRYAGWNITDFSPILEDMNKVYSNGASEIYITAGL